MLFVPCSRVGHIYRLSGWSGNPPPEYVPSNPSLRVHDILSTYKFSLPIQNRPCDLSFCRTIFVLWKHGGMNTKIISMQADLKL